MIYFISWSISNDCNIHLFAARKHGIFLRALMDLISAARDFNKMSLSLPILNHSVRIFKFALPLNWNTEIINMTCYHDYLIIKLFIFKLNFYTYIELIEDLFIVLDKFYFRSLLSVSSIIVPEAFRLRHGSLKFSHAVIKYRQRMINHFEIVLMCGLLMRSSCGHLWWDSLQGWIETGFLLVFK